MKIILQRVSNGFRARLSAEGHKFGPKGTSQAEAIGKLVLASPNQFGIEAVQKPPRLCRPAQKPLIGWEKVAVAALQELISDGYLTDSTYQEMEEKQVEVMNNWIDLHQFHSIVFHKVGARNVTVLISLATKSPLVNYRDGTPPNCASSWVGYDAQIQIGATTTKLRRVEPFATKEIQQYVAREYHEGKLWLIYKQ